MVLKIVELASDNYNNLFVMCAFWEWGESITK